MLSTMKLLFLADVGFDRVCLIVLFSGIVFVVLWWLFLGVLLCILINTPYFFTIGHVGLELK